MEIVEIIKEYIKPELLILVPVLYILGIGFKKTTIIKDKFIPICLGLVSIILTGLYVFANSEISGAKEIVMAIFIALTQGILLAGASVYVNQILKQAQKVG